MAAVGGALCSGCTMMLWKLLSLLALFSTMIYTKEYCDTDGFQARCQEGQVIVIESAHYGRMEHGHCITDDFGHMGCKADVRPLMDQMCSGKEACEISAVIQTFKKSSQCPTGLIQYLEVHVKCVTAYFPSSSQCLSSSAVYAPPPPGVLANLVPQQSQCSSQYSTWIIEVSATQKVNISLLDFGTLNKDQTTCQQYAIIREEAREVDTEICGSFQRSRHVYTSHRNKVEVSLAGPEQLQGTYFLMQYEGIGCIEPVFPSDMWMKVSPEGVTLGCYTSKLTWKLTCVDKSWQGVVGNCSTTSVEGTNLNPANSTWNFLSPSSEGGLTFLVAAVAVVITVTILVVALLYTNRGPAPAIALGSLDEPYEAKDITFFRDDPRPICQNDMAASTMPHTHTNGMPWESCVSVPVSNSDSDTYASENATLPLRAHDMEGFDSTLQPPLPSKNKQPLKPPNADIPPPELPPKCPPKVGGGKRRNDLGPYTRLNADSTNFNRDQQLAYKSLQKDNTNLTRPLPPVPVNPL